MTRWPVAEPETITTRMSDGTALVADVYRPVGKGPFPVLSMRQPYGRKVASTVVLAHPAWYASQGYIVMVQDVRGRGDSGGTFRILQDDIGDGAETLAAAADLPGGDGRVATYGFSYQGMTQLMGLAGALRGGVVKPAAMVVTMAPWNVRDHWAFEGDVFRMQANQYWAVQMATENARIKADGEAYHALRSAKGGLCAGPVPARLDALDRYPHYTHYHAWLADAPTYWAQCSPHAALDGLMLDVPNLQIGGWLDVMLEGTFALHKGFAASGAESRMLVGPWQHLPWGRFVGALDCGDEAAGGVDAASVAFFDHVLKDAPLSEPAIRLFDLGRKTFVGFPTLPETKTRTLHLASTGRAAPTTDDGALLPEPSEAEGTDRFVHDPWRPTPAVGLALGTPSGYQDRAGADDRADVAVYTTAPLDDELTLCGAPRVTLHVSSDRPSYDLHAVLSVVDRGGHAMTLTSGYRRVQCDAAPVHITMARTMMTVPAGARLRLSLQGAAWPAFMVNPGTGQRPEDAALSDCLVTTLAVRHGAEAPSTLELPVLA